MGKAQESAERTVAMEGGRAASVAAPQREEIGQALERLSRLLIRRGPDPAPEDGARSRAADGEKERIREALGFFGQVA
ncbi:MAG TPA: hypothetical protein VFI13_10435, partial [Gemmatimonadales bacterium]|nr:hypothetical protein [Gemmatimonadales bacterium]